MFEEKNKTTQQSDYSDLSTLDTPEKRLDHVKTLIQSLYHNLDKLSHTVEKIQQEQKKELYKKMPGIEGVFDGVCLTADDGSKHEVPANYAAKSRLVYGDKLKIVEEDGKKVFKQIQKPERQEVKGVLSKKEGKWYLLADQGTYKISDVAAEFNRVELNDEAVGLIPEKQTNVPYAALDKVLKKGESAVVDTAVHKDEKKVEKVVEKAKEKPVVHQQLKTIFSKPVPVVSKPSENRTKFSKPLPMKPREERKEFKRPIGTTVNKPAAQPEAPKEYVAGILDDDDLR
jgi:hypothetical protein